MAASACFCRAWTLAQKGCHRSREKEDGEADAPDPGHRSQLQNGHEIHLAVADISDGAVNRY